MVAVRSGELSGRSFFLTALVEYDARPGTVRDELVRRRGCWQDLFVTFLQTAQQRGQLRVDVAGEQVFFEVASLVAGATLDAQLRDDRTVFDRARTTVLERLLPLVTPGHALPAPATGT